MLDTPEAAAVLDVNDSGYVLGTKVTWRVRDRVQRNTFTNADARGIALVRDADKVVGELTTGLGARHAVVLHHHPHSVHVIVDLGTLPAGGDSLASAISGSVTVGRSDDPTPGHGTHAMWLVERHGVLGHGDLNDYVPAGVDRMLQDPRSKALAVWQAIARAGPA